MLCNPAMYVCSGGMVWMQESQIKIKGCTGKGQGQGLVSSSGQRNGEWAETTFLEALSDKSVNQETKWPPCLGTVVGGVIDGPCHTSGSSVLTFSFARGGA